MAWRWVWIVGGGLIAVVVAAGVAAVAFALTRGPAWVGDRASTATGRSVEIGSLDIGWGRAPIIHLTDVSVANVDWRSEEHTSELQSLLRSSYAVFCLKKKNTSI